MMPILLMRLLTICWVRGLDIKRILKRKSAFEIFAGADNLFDTKYSLGNDINAFGGRYYNAAAGRNYYVGISFRFDKK